MVPSPSSPDVVAPGPDGAVGPGFQAMAERMATRPPPAPRRWPTLMVADTRRAVGRGPVAQVTLACMIPQLATTCDWKTMPGLGPRRRGRHQGSHTYHPHGGAPASHPDRRMTFIAFHPHNRKGHAKERRPGGSTVKLRYFRGRPDRLRASSGPFMPNGRRGFRWPTARSEADSGPGAGQGSGRNLLCPATLGPKRHADSRPLSHAPPAEPRLRGPENRSGVAGRTAARHPRALAGFPPPHRSPGNPAKINI